MQLALGMEVSVTPAEPLPLEPLPPEEPPEAACTLDNSCWVDAAVSNCLPASLSCLAFQRPRNAKARLAWGQELMRSWDTANHK